MRKRSRVPSSWSNVRDIQLCDYIQAYKILDRYWGESSPYQTLNAETLQLLTLEQSIADLVHFAKVAPLPFDSKKSNADKAPWVFSGGSYSGALAAWIESTSPGTFWAYHASSAPVQAIDDYVSMGITIQQIYANAVIVAILLSCSTGHAQELQQRYLSGH